MESWRKGGSSWGFGSEEVTGFSFYYVDGGYFEFFVDVAVAVDHYDFRLGGGGCG